jgi:hypothetical protein
MVQFFPSCWTSVKILFNFWTNSDSSVIYSLWCLLIAHVTECERFSYWMWKVHMLTEWYVLQLLNVKGATLA